MPLVCVILLPTTHFTFLYLHIRFIGACLVFKVFWFWLTVSIDIGQYNLLLCAGAKHLLAEAAHENAQRH
jgi:uncharacterized membrane protein